ncbi:sulfite exporter TauE/SafE family protein [Candidatus Nitrosocosmicus arcticus]|uniref:Probable membrane transporter protein n=1 Tax=Candidatus Nitrosocosmicus arcticus TaxID=2035267 RepID=A0A557STE1_9ARCH|nr:sulfite exporter TauE/SafE family protein [Candidatus Nitrosocosmicus arcticus]TVP39873.1 TSUP family transporter [Candidatus Nitrosocosmicus arcticus]
MITDVLIAFVVSIAAGLIGSMVGIGGGIINAPYLSYLNYIPSQISSTSLIAVFFTSMSSSYQYIRKGLTEKRIGLILAFSSIPGTFIGVYISNYITLNEFRFYFALILIATSLYLLFRSKILGQEKRRQDLSHTNNYLDFSRLLILVIFSLLAGTLSSSFGIGGGIIFVPCLIILLGFNMKTASATSQFALIFTSLSGLTLFIIDGKPDYYMGFILSVGSIIGGTVGSMLTGKMKSHLLLKIFSIILLIVSLKLIYDGLG